MRPFRLIAGLARALVLTAPALATPALATPAWAADPSAAEIVAATDRVRNPDKPFSTRITLTEYVEGKPRDTVELTVYARLAKVGGQFRSLVAFNAPVRDAGKLMLRQANEVWFYDPAAKSSVRISPQQRLLGQASNGDVMTANFALDYDVTLDGIETVKDAERTDRRSWKLRMTAKPDAVGLAYHAIDFWVEQGTYRPVTGRFYADSGRLLKLAYYRGYREELGEMRATEVVILDGVDKTKVTRMRFSDYRYRDMPEEWFQRSFLPRFRAE